MLPGLHARTMTRSFATAMFFAACSSPAQTVAQSDAPVASEGVDLTPDLQPIATQYQLPALAALAADDVSILGEGVTGVRKIGDPTLATLGDTWHLGSDTKAMTATLIARFVEAGTLSWDMRLADAFPGVTIDPGYQNVTLAMLLAHVGGAPADLPADVAAQMSGAGTSQALRLAAVSAMLSRPPGATVGTFTYSNAGYMMAGAALERATGMAWEDLMRDRLFAPLSMTTCGFGPNATANTVDEPWGHTLVGGMLVAMNVDNPPALGPAGTVHCSLADWLAFLREHLGGALGHSTVLGLSATTWATLHTPWPGSDYALGWGVQSRSWAGGVTFAHVGSNTLNVADVWIAPAIDRIFIATSNRGDDAAITAADAAIGDLVSRFPSP
jgi:D-alanyl-D-alanine carboxypeptidase